MSIVAILVQSVNDMLQMTNNENLRATINEVNYFNNLSLTKMTYAINNCNTRRMISRLQLKTYTYRVYISMSYSFTDCQLNPSAEM
jgi:hypothetical protein